VNTMIWYKMIMSEFTSLDLIPFRNQYTVMWPNSVSLSKLNLAVFGPINHGAVCLISVTYPVLAICNSCMKQVSLRSPSELNLSSLSECLDGRGPWYWPHLPGMSVFDCEVPFLNWITCIAINMFSLLVYDIFMTRLLCC